MECNSEKIATNILSELVNQNSNRAFEHFLQNEISDEQLNFLTTRLKELGNQEYHKGEYANAIDYYCQALAGEKNTETRVKLLNNISASYSELKNFEKALEYSQHAISIEPESAKSWFRAAQVFLKKEEYAICLNVLRAALKKKKDLDVDSLNSWICKVELLATKEKALKRVSADYSRFSEITNNDEIEDNNLSKSSSCIQYSENLTDQQKTELNQMLFGLPQEGNVQGNKNKNRVNIDLNNIQSYKDLIIKCKHISNLSPIYKGLLTLLQTQSELTCIRRIVESQLLKKEVLTTELFARSIKSVFKHHIEHEIYEERIQYITGIFVFGTGCGISAILAENFLSELKTHCVELPPCFACTNQSLPFTGWLLLCALRNIKHDNSAPLVKILSKSIYQLSVQSQDVDNPPKVTKTIDAEENEKNSNFSQFNNFKKEDTYQYDMSSTNKINTVFIDPDLFDCSGIGNGLIKQFKYLRKHIVTQSELEFVSPNCMELWAYGAWIGIDKQELNNLFQVPSIPESSRLIKPNVSTKEAQSIFKSGMLSGCWSVNWEPFSLPESKLLKGWIPYTESRLLYSFRFDGTLENIENDLPQYNKKIIEFATNISYNSLFGKRQHYINAVVVDVRLKMPFKCENRSRWVHGVHSTGIHWLEPVKLQCKEIIKIEFIQTETKLSFRVLHPEQPRIPIHQTKLQNIAFYTLWDKTLITCWGKSLMRNVSNLLLHKSHELETFSHTQLEKHEKSIKSGNVSKYNHLQILIYKSYSGILATASLSEALKCVSKRSSLPNPSFHIFCVEPFEDNTAIFSQTLQYFSYTLYKLVEKHKRKSLPFDFKEKWKNFDSQPNLKKQMDKFITTKQTELESFSQFKLKLSSLLTFLSADVREIRPPQEVENGKRQLALAKFLDLPVGTQEFSAMSAKVENRIPQLADISVLAHIDCCLIGNGLIPLYNYAIDALVTKKAKILPQYARICGTIVQLGKNTNTVHGNEFLVSFISDIDVAIGSSSSGYIPCIIEQYHHKVLSDSQIFFEYDFTEKKNIPINQSSIINFNVLSDGIANAVLLWIDVVVDRDNENDTNLGFTTKPEEIQPPLETIKSKPYFQGLKHAELEQALCLFGSKSLYFTKDERISIKVHQEKANIAIEWNINEISNFTLRKWPASQLKLNSYMIKSWTSTVDEHCRNLSTMTSLLSSTENIKEVINVALTIASDPSTFTPAYKIDSYEAQRLLWTLLI